MSVRFADASVADFFDSCVDRGLAPARFGRVWLHTHPGASVTPSWTDEETFARAFGSCDWAVMFILGRTAQTYARLAFSAGPGGQVLIPTQVDWSAWPKLIAGQHSTMDAHFAKWQEEYAANIRMWPDRYVDPFARPDRTIATPSDANWIDNFDPWAIEDLYHDYFSDDGASGHAAARDCAAGTAG